MSGIDFRGRRRFRDSDATERLSALLAEDRAGDASHAARGFGATHPDAASGDVVDGAAGEPVPTVPAHGTDDPFHGSDRPTTDSSASSASAHSKHREDVAVRRRLSRPALVLLCVVLLLALGAGCAALLNGGADDDALIASAEASPPARGHGEDAAGGSGRTSAPDSPARAAPRPDAPNATGGTSDRSAPAEPGGVITVHVVGEVKDPSVVTLPPGARVMDAVQAAGGFTPVAVKHRVNLAQTVADGAQIVIPNRGNADEVTAAGSAPGAGEPGTGPAAGTGPATRNDAPAQAPRGAPGPGAPGAGSPGAATGALINLNTATEAELEDLPKVGPVLAQRIVEFRTQHGAFTSPEQLDDVSGVGPAMLDALLPLVTV